MKTADSKILVVDDNEDNRYTLVRRLERTGYQDVTEAVDGEDALAQLAAHPFDLVLLDVMMPKVNGYQVLELMKADLRQRDIPVIMISALSEFDSVVRCIELGAEDYLPKPFNPVLLKARLTACLERKRFRDIEQAHLAEIEAQRRRADELLHVILPEKAVIELKQHDRVCPRRYDHVALLFCDIIDFTSYCDQHAAEEVVANLGLVMEAWEEAIADHGLEKITSMGDGVFATANLLNEHPDPVAACVKCAFPLIDVAAKSPANWGLRVGVHTGSVIAGIVGRSKFRFDVCGDAVNVTARLADFGSEPNVYLTRDAWLQINDRCDGQSLGPVAIKGKQEMEVIKCLSIRE